MCQDKECTEDLGFDCDDEFANNDADLPIQFKNYISSCSTIIYNALTHENVLPTAGKTVLATCNGFGYTFICHSYVLFHPNLQTNPISLLPTHPEQGMMSYDEYVQATEFHYNIQGLISNHCFKYDDENI